MSATINAEKFANFFGKYSIQSVYELKSEVSLKNNNYSKGQKNWRAYAKDNNEDTWTTPSQKLARNMESAPIWQ